MKKLLSVIMSMTMILAVPLSADASSRYNENFTCYEYMEDLSYEKSKGVNYDSVVVVNTESLDSDGLSASGLIGASNGVICAVNPFDFSERKPTEYLERMLNKNKVKTVYFIGGEKVLPDKFKRVISNKGYNCITLAGDNRIETSYKVAREIKKLKSVNEIAITKGFGGEPDSVSIAYEARQRKMPVILTNGKSIPFSTNGVKTYAIGGTSVISDALAKKTNAIRLGGVNRYETNRKILEYFKRDNGKYSLCMGKSDYGNMRMATLVGCLSKADPVVLVDKKSDKSILAGINNANYYLWGSAIADPQLRAECYNASFGTDVTKAADAIYKATNAVRGDDFFVYHYKDDSYVTASKDYKKYKNDFYIFDLINIEYGYADFNILVRKTDNKLFIWNPGEVAPAPYK